MEKTATKEEIEELKTLIAKIMEELDEAETLWLELFDKAIAKDIDVLVNCALSSLKDISGTRAELEFLQDLIKEEL